MILKIGFFFSKHWFFLRSRRVFGRFHAIRFVHCKVEALSERKVRSVLVTFSVFRSCTVRMLIFIMFPLHFIVKHIATAGQFTAFNLLSPRLKEGTWIWQGVLCYKQDTVHETKKILKWIKITLPQITASAFCVFVCFVFLISFLLYVI